MGKVISCRVQGILSRIGNLFHKTVGGQMAKRFFITVSLLVGFQGLEIFCGKGFLALIDCQGLETFPTKLFAKAPDTLWTKTYGGTSEDYGRSVEECADSGFIIAGMTGFFGARDVYLIRTNADGAPLWTRTYGGSKDDHGYSVEECTGGGFIIAGETESFGAIYCDIYLIRIGSGVGIEEERFFPFADAHGQNDRLEVYPNPSTTVVRVQWLGVNEGQKVSLKVYDLGGRLVKTLLNNEVISGNKIEVRLDELTKGIYFVKMEAGNYKATKKLTIIR